ncbi:hypothetical protein HY382_03075 [Candidatus Curtissbacteria bacterium]|nr:hypothetical protein [Candidatus Curtissbacteria bacterium]
MRESPEKSSPGWFAKIQAKYNAWKLGSAFLIETEFVQKLGINGLLIDLTTVAAETIFNRREGLDVSDKEEELSGIVEKLGRDINNADAALEIKSQMYRILQALVLEGSARNTFRYMANEVNAGISVLRSDESFKLASDYYRENPIRESIDKIAVKK